MSTAEVKEELQEMCSEERKEIANFLNELMREDAQATEIVGDADFEASAAKVVERHGELLKGLAK